MSEHLPARVLCDSAKLFGIPQIEIVSPRLVVALGLACFNGLRRARSLRAHQNTEAAIAEPLTISGSVVWCQAHTSPRGQNLRNRRDGDRVAKDWKAMGDWFRSDSLPSGGRASLLVK